MDHIVSRRLGVLLSLLFFLMPVTVPATESREADTVKLYVKLIDDLPVRANEQTRRLFATTDVDVNAAALTALNEIDSAKWQPVHTIPAERLTEFRQRGQERTGRDLPDLTVEFYLQTPWVEEESELIESLSSNPLVQHVYVYPPFLPELPVPDFQGSQTYLTNPQDGVGASAMWSMGITGPWVTIALVEYGFNANHQDLPAIPVVHGYPSSDSGHINHGTATLGVLASTLNGWGTTGIAHGAALIFSSALTNPSGTQWSFPSAITAAMNNLQSKDVMLVNLQRQHPVTQAFVPVEYYLGEYNAIKTAVSNGISVVIAAGNGSQDLDNATNAPGSNNHYPFKRINDSGAVYAGAGAPPSASNPRSRLWFSNYGARLDLQGQGAVVFTTGYGDAYSAGGLNLYYTGSYGGTSSASPIVAGAVAVLQSAHIIQYGTAATPAHLRNALVNTGVVQNMAVSGKIGPQPSLPGAYHYITTSPPSLWVQDHFCYGQGSASWSSVPSTFVYQLRALTDYNFEYDAYVGSNTSTSLNVSEITHYRVRACTGAIGSGAGCTPWSSYAGPLQYHPICW